MTVLPILLLADCGGSGAAPTPPTSPTPTVTASAYILPDAVSLNDQAFGDDSPATANSCERLTRSRWAV